MAIQRNFLLMMVGPLALVLSVAIGDPVLAQSEQPHAVMVGPAEDVPEGSTVPDYLPYYSKDKGEPLGPEAAVADPEPLWGFLTGFSLGTRTWLAWGQSKSNYGGQGPFGFVDQLSNLRWRNMISEAGEAEAGALLFGRLVLSADVGGGSVNSGKLIDDEYGASGQQDLLSETISPTGNHGLTYSHFDIGWRCWQSAHCAFDGLIGYQYWRENYGAVGGTQTVSSPEFPGPPGGNYPPTPFVTEQYTWQGFEVGAQGIVNFCDRWAVKARVMFMPVTKFENDDVQYANQMTVTDRATGGFGGFGDFRVSYWLCHGLFVELGYRVWDAQSGSGETVERMANGTEANLPFNQATTLRQGFTLGFDYQF